VVSTQSTTRYGYLIFFFFFFFIINKNKWEWGLKEIKTQIKNQVVQ
jgi:hypothetical protein